MPGAERKTRSQPQPEGQSLFPTEYYNVARGDMSAGKVMVDILVEKGFPIMLVVPAGAADSNMLRANFGTEEARKVYEISWSTSEHRALYFAFFGDISHSDLRNCRSEWGEENFKRAAGFAYDRHVQKDRALAQIAERTVEKLNRGEIVADVHVQWEGLDCNYDSVLEELKGLDPAGRYKWLYNHAQHIIEIEDDVKTALDGSLSPLAPEDIRTLLLPGVNRAISMLPYYDEWVKAGVDAGKIAQRARKGLQKVIRTVQEIQRKAEEGVSEADPKN